MLGKFKGIILEIIKYLLVRFALRHALSVVRDCNGQTFESCRFVWNFQTQHLLLKSRSIGVSVWFFVSHEFMSKKRIDPFSIHEMGTKTVHKHTRCP